ncbi:MAG: MMPL family transporter, partial [Candidatus Dormibacteraeota bacterium]|nr:MMPL family transporter [Candidatus Dormibacteraeota bacterium]
LPGGVGQTLGSLNPLTVVLGALVIALGTEFAVMLLSRFYEERRRGLDPDEAAAAALHGVGRAIRISALTLGAGFGVLAISGLFPNSFPLIADFGLAVVIDLALAVGAVFLVMLPVAVALERRSPMPQLVVAPASALEKEAATASPARPKRRPAPRQALPEEPEAPAEEEPPAAEVQSAQRRLPGVSGRRRRQSTDATAEVPPTEESQRHRPGVSGRRRRPPRGS